MQDDLVTPHLKATKSALDQVSNSLCLAKWSQATLHLHNGNTQSCHHVRSHRINSTEIATRPEALHNTSEKQAARAKMLEGKRPSECSYCWTAEDRGRVSDRILKSSEYWALPYMSEILKSGTGASISPRYLEVSFDSACNFRCMYCGPAFSSSWMNEIKEFGPYPTLRKFNNLATLKRDGVLPLTDEDKVRYTDAFWKWWPELSLNLEDFRVTGGEPFLSEQTFRVLNWLYENPRPRLGFAINSNMGIGEKKMDRALEMINRLQGRVRAFTLFTSMDCVGSRAEYIRFGLDFKSYHANVENLLSRTEWPITVAYMITVNALSVTGLKDLMAMILDQRRRYPQHTIQLDTPFLQNPNHLSVGILTKDFVAYIDATVEFMRTHRVTNEPTGFSESEIVKVDRIRDLILTPRHSRLLRSLLRRDFDSMFTEYDRRRQTDFASTFPEYSEFRALCKKWAITSLINGD